MSAAYNRTMDVNLTPEQESRLLHIAETTGRGTDEVVQEALENLFAYDEWFREKVGRSIGQVDRGEVISHEEVGIRLGKWLRRG